MNDDITIQFDPGHGKITAGKGVIDSLKAGVYGSAADLAVDGLIVTSKNHDVLSRPSFDQVKILTSTVKISDTAMALAFNKDVDYDNHIKRQAALKLMEQLLDDGFITFQKIATAEPTTVLQAKIIAIQQEDI